MARRKRTLDHLTDLHGFAGPADVTTARRLDTFVDTPMRNVNATHHYSAQAARVEPPVKSNAGSSHCVRRLQDESRNSPKAGGGVGRPMAGRMKGFFSPSPNPPSFQPRQISTNSRFYTSHASKQHSFPQRNVEPEPTRFQPSEANTLRRPSLPQNPQPYPVQSGALPFTAQAKLQTQPKRRKDVSAPHLNRNTSSSTTLPNNVKRLRMAGAQRISMLGTEGLERPEKCQPHSARALKSFLATRAGSGKEIDKVIDLTAEPETQQPTKGVEDELVSDSDDGSLQLTDDSHGSLLRTLKEVPRSSSLPDGKENRPSIIDLSQDDGPFQSRLTMKRNRPPSIPISKPPAEQLGSIKVDHSRDPHKWKKVSTPLQSFKSIEEIEHSRKGTERSKPARGIAINQSKCTDECKAVPNSGGGNCSKYFSFERGNHTGLKTSQDRYNDVSSSHVSENIEKKRNRLSLYRKEKEMHVETVKRSCLQNITSSLTKRVHPPSGDARGDGYERHEPNGGVAELHSQENEILEVPVAKEAPLPLAVKHHEVHEKTKNIRLRPLTVDELSEVRSVTRGVWKQQPLAFVKKANIVLRGEDFARLRGCRWLNDEVMNSFMALINTRNDQFHNGDGEVTMTDVNNVTANFANKSDVQHDFHKLFTMSRPRTHAFNTFFFERLTQGDGYDYRGVRRWLIRAGRDIRNLDLILVPVNLSQFHWVLAAIDLRNCQFLYFDSTLGLDSNNATGILKLWLMDEVSDKAGKDIADKMEISEWRAIVNPSYLPYQQDSGSCGVFTLYMADYLERGVKPDFCSMDIQTLRQRTVLFLKRGELPD